MSPLPAALFLLSAAAHAGDCSLPLIPEDPDEVRRVIADINAIRAARGLDPVVQDPRHTQDVAEAARIIVKTKSLDHNPSSDTLCWTPGAAKASATSLLSSSMSVNGRTRSFGPVAEWISEAHSPGDGAATLGHRRWLLWPSLRKVTYASQKDQQGDLTVFAAGLKVFDKAEASAPLRFEAGPNAPIASTPRAPDFVAHPFADTPSHLLPDRTLLSFSLTGAQWVGTDGSGRVDYTSARVDLQQDGRALPVGELSWTGPGPGNVLAFSAKIRPDLLYRVTVRDIRVNGQTLDPFSYTFRLVD